MLVYEYQHPVVANSKFVSYHLVGGALNAYLCTAQKFIVSRLP